MNYKQSFVLYESVYAQFERLLKADKLEGASRYIDVVMRYGLYGVVPDDEDEVWLYGLDNVMASIDSAKSNYRKKINIPKDDLENYLRQGMTQVKIAEIFNCSVDTIQRRIKEYGLSTLPPEDYFFEDDTADTANSGIKTGRNYNYHSLSPSHSYSLSDLHSTSLGNEKESNAHMMTPKELGF